MVNITANLPSLVINRSLEDAGQRDEPQGVLFISKGADGRQTVASGLPLGPCGNQLRHGGRTTSDAIISSHWMLNGQIKPDGVQRGLVGELLHLFHAGGR